MHVILILLLRLRQACSHPALISTMLDDDTVGGKDSRDFAFTPSNPIFDRLSISSKMKFIIEVIQKVVHKREKSLIISQWVNVLEIIAGHLHVLKIWSRSITSQVKDRARSVIIEDFNEDLSGPPIIFLSDSFSRFFIHF
jgi:SNF2 family DNA or RNA helicase